MDVVVREGSAILKLLSGEDKSLLIWRDTFLVLNLGLDVLNRVGRLHLERHGLSGEGFHEDLHVALLFCGTGGAGQREAVAGGGGGSRPHGRCGAACASPRGPWQRSLPSLLPSGRVLPAVAVAFLKMDTDGGYTAAAAENGGTRKAATAARAAERAQAACVDSRPNAFGLHLVGPTYLVLLLLFAKALRAAPSRPASRQW